MKLSQITTKDNNVFDSTTPQQKIMADLDWMSKMARKIKNKKKKKKKPRSYGQSPDGPSSGHLDTQLFPPRKMKAEASKKAKATFFKREIEKQSYWVVQYDGKEARLTIGELFPSGLYDVKEIKSKEFGIALILRLSKGELLEESLKLMRENGLQFTEISVEDVKDNDKTISLISYAIPLNDYQKTIRDSMVQKSIQEMQNGY